MAAEQARAKKLKFFFLSHASAGEPFWGVVQKGMNAASNQFGVSTKYVGADNKVEVLANNINTVLASKPDGIVVTITDPNAVQGPLNQAIKRGIPVVAVNVNDPRPESQRIKYQTYVGGDEYLQGRRAAQIILAHGKPKRSLCTLVIPGHIGLELRCKGFHDVMTAAGVKVDKFDVGQGGTDVSVITESIRNWFKRNKDADSIMGLGATLFPPIATVLKEEKLLGKVLWSNIDWDAAMAPYIKAGTLLGTTDQVPYLQGYYPVEFLWQMATYGIAPVSDVLTGPLVIDKRNVDSAVKRTKLGIA